MKRKFLFILASIFFLPSITWAAGRFTDVKLNDPSYQAIEYLRTKGIVQGYADGTFKPHQQSNRAETLAMLLRGKKAEIPQKENIEVFPDVQGDTWYGPYVQKAKELGIVHGNPDGLFYPGNSTNVSEFLKMLLELHAIELRQVDSDPFSDVPANRWDAPYIETAKWLNLMNTLESEDLHPAHAMSRGEMAQYLYRLITGYHEGIASYYGSGFDGASTSSGEALNNNDFVAAHKRLPFGSWAKVTHLETGKSIQVRIIDRGPYTEGRVIDLSQAAFESIAPLSSGIAPVSVLPIKDPNQICQAQESGIIPKNAFESIVLETEPITSYIEGETLILKGKIESEATQVTGFLINSAGAQWSQTSPLKEGNFELRLNLMQSGNLHLGLLVGEAGSANTYSVESLPRHCLQSETSQNLSAPQNLTLHQDQGDLTIHWEKGNYNLFKLTFSQNGLEKVFFTPEAKLTPPYAAFENFKEGEVKLSLQGTWLNANESLAKKNLIYWSLPNVTHFQATTHDPYFLNSQELSVLQLPSEFSANENVLLNLDPLTNIQQNAWITFPDGSSKSYKLTGTINIEENEKGEEIFPTSANSLKLSFLPTQSKVHRIEWNNDQGIAALNVSLYPKGVYPLLPNPNDFPQKKMDLGTNLDKLQQQFLTLVNQDRNQNGSPSLSMGPALNQLAQARAEDMAEKDYFSHWNMEGKTVNDLRGSFGIKEVVSENLARENSMILAQYGLTMSASHQVNLLNPHWTRVGFGVAKNKDESYTFVQLFSADPIDLNQLEPLRETLLNNLNDNRSLPITLSESLNTQAQQWSQRMIKEDFFSFEAKNGETLVDQLHQAGIESTLGTYLVGNTSFEQALEKITQNNEIQSGSWKEIGIGLAQDEFGVIKITLIYVE